MKTRPELPPCYTVVDLRETEGRLADGSYCGFDNDGRPYQVRRCGELIPEIVDGRVGGSYFAARNKAVEACWEHWREHGDATWVAFIDSLPSLDELTREPFTGFLEVTNDHRAAAQAVADNFASTFEVAGLLAPTADTAIFSANLQQFAEQALSEPGSKVSKLVSAIFNDKTPQGQACSLMLAQLLMRLYSAPYPGLNEAGLDFVNVFVGVVTTAFAGMKSTPKFGGKAKGKRPS